jgi:hypothetical protein
MATELRFPVEIDAGQAAKELDKLQRDMDRLKKNMESGEAKRAPIVEQLKQAQDEAAQAYDKVEKLKSSLAESEAKTAINANADPQTWIEETQRQAEIKAQLSEQEKILAAKEKAAQRLEAQDAKIVDKLKQQTAELEEQKKRAGELTQTITDASKGADIKAAMEGAQQSIKSGIKNLLKYGIGIRSLFVLFRKLKQYTVEAVKAYAENDPETQKSINELKASLQGLKASWGANVKAEKTVDKLSHLRIHRTGGSKDFLRVVLPGEHRLVFVLLLVHRVKRVKNALDKVNVGEVEQHRHLSVDGDFLHSGIMSKFKHCLTSKNSGRRGKLDSAAGSLRHRANGALAAVGHIDGHSDAAAALAAETRDLDHAGFVAFGKPGVSVDNEHVHSRKRHRVLIDDGKLPDLLLRSVAAVQLARLERLRNDRLFHRAVSVAEDVLLAFGRPVVFLGAVLYALADHRPNRSRTRAGIQRSEKQFPRHSLPRSSGKRVFSHSLNHLVN